MTAMTFPPAFAPRNSPAAHETALRRTVLACYLLYALTPLACVAGIAAAVLGFMKRRQATGTWLDSHFRWQLATFWGSAAALLAWSFTYRLPLGELIGPAWALWLGFRVIWGFRSAWRFQPVVRPWRM